MLYSDLHASLLSGRGLGAEVSVPVQVVIKGGAVGLLVVFRWVPAAISVHAVCSIPDHCDGPEAGAA